MINKIWAVLLALLLLVSCSLDVPIDARITFNEPVIITSGFYKNCTGIVKEYDRNWKRYDVDFSNGNCAKAGVREVRLSNVIRNVKEQEGE